MPVTCGARPFRIRQARSSSCAWPAAEPGNAASRRPDRGVVPRADCDMVPPALRPHRLRPECAHQLLRPPWSPGHLRPASWCRVTSSSMPSEKNCSSSLPCLSGSCRWESFAPLAPTGEQMIRRRGRSREGCAAYSRSSAPVDATYRYHRGTVDQSVPKYLL